MSEICTCSMCGYQWRRGMSGEHSCATAPKDQLREINGCLDWGAIASGRATTLSEVQRTIAALRETQHGRDQDRIKHEMEADKLRAELATLRDGWLQERQKFASIVSHLEAPHSFKAEEPGVYIHLVHVCTDGSGIVSMFKKVEEVKCAEGEEPLYPCKEWREFHAKRTKHVMPYKWSDMAPPTDGRAE